MDTSPFSYTPAAWAICGSKISWCGIFRCGRSHKQKQGPGSGPFFVITDPTLDPVNVFGLQPFRALLYLEFHFGAFIQAAVAICLNRGKVNKNIVAARTLDESIAFCGIKPLHGTFFLHCTFS